MAEAGGGRREPGRETAPPLLRIENLYKAYDQHLVLRDIDLAVGEHEVVCLIGASGCGKSTLLRCINLLEEINAGQISLDDELITGPLVNQNRVRQRIGLVFQSYNLFPHMSVLDRLSGGQQQRVAIVRALALKPELLLLDEVTSALDPEMVGEVLDVIAELKGLGMTMILATHQMGFAEQIANRVVFLDQGVILEQGPARQVLREPRHPRTRQFLERVLSAAPLAPATGGIETPRLTPRLQSVEPILLD
jgi:polar amino acid transport system ATP-binding protein